MFHELEEYKQKALFITLTYDDRHLPLHGSLEPRDLQLFWKRLRKRLNGRKVSYYAVGEYGEVTQRPHYHAILFGLGVDECEFLHVDARSSFMYHPLVSKSWDKGLIHTGTVTFDSIVYVAGYINKKLVGDSAGKEYFATHRVAPFSACESAIRRKLGNCEWQCVAESVIFNAFWGKVSYSPLL